MAKENEDTLPFLVLNEVMDDDYREAVAKRALDYRSEATQHARRCLNRAIRRDVRVRGYRHPDRARTHLLLKPVIERSYHSNELMGSMLQVWVESQTDLHAAVVDFLDSREESAVDFSDLEDGFPRAWSVTEMEDIGKAFQQGCPDFEYNDVALMLCCLRGLAPLPDEYWDASDEGTSFEEVHTEEEEQEEAEPLLWDQWLEESRDLPAAAPEWDAVSDFLDALVELTTEKLEERRAAFTYAILQGVLNDLAEHASDELEYFGLEPVDSWFVEACPIDEAETWLAEIASFEEALVQHRETRMQSGTRLAEERKRRDTLVKLEEAVLESYERLKAVFVTEPPPDEPEPIPEGGVPGSEEESSEEEGAPPDVEPEPVAQAQAVEEEELVEEESLPLEEEEVEGVLVQEVEPAEKETAREEVAAQEVTEAPSPVVAEDSVEPSAEAEEVLEAQAKQPEEKPIPEPQEPAPVDAGAPVEFEEEAAQKEEAGPEFAAPGPIELRSAKEAATLLKTDDSDENWEGFLWSLIAEDDLPAAYWLARSLTASGRTVPLPYGLLAAAQGARWLSPDTDLYTYDLLDLVESCRADLDPVQEMIGLAASLRPALVMPHSGLAGWLVIGACDPVLRNLANAVRGFADLGIALRPEDLLGVAGAEKRESALMEAAHSARRWLEDAQERRVKFKRASDVWRQLARRDLLELLDPVVENRQAELGGIRRRLEQWQQPWYVSDQIDQIDREFVGTKGRPISGFPRQQIVRRVEEACSIAGRWCSLVEHEREIETRGKWLFDQIASLRAALQDILPKADDWLVGLVDSGQPAPIVAASCCLRRALHQLQDTVALQSLPRAAVPLSTNSWASLQVDVENLYMALGRRLLWLPDLSLSDRGLPAESDLSRIPVALQRACEERLSLRDSFDGWIRKQDYRFVEWFLQALHDEVDIVELSARVQEAMAGSRAALAGSKDQTLDAIEQAVVDGIIGDQRSEFGAVVESVDPAETLEFDSKYEDLREIREALSEARRKRLLELRAKWEELQEQLAQFHLKREERDQLRQFFQTGLDREDTRVVEEGLARLTATLDSGRELDKSLFSDAAARDPLVEFQETESEIQKWLEETPLQRVATQINYGRAGAPLKFGEIPAKRRSEASGAIHSWRRLKQQPPLGAESYLHMTTLLEYLGFSPVMSV